MISKDVVNSWNFVQVKYPLITILSLSDALYLSYLLEQDKFFNNGIKSSEGWFFLKRRIIEKRLNIGISSQKLIEKRLEEKKYIKKDKQSKRTLYKINYGEIQKDVESKGTDYAPSKGTDYAPSNNKSILSNKNRKTNINISNGVLPPAKAPGALSLNDFNTFIPLLKKWNSYSSFRQIRLPKNNSDTATKTVKETIKLIKLLLNGEIHIHISNGLNKKKVYGMMEIEQSFKHLKKAIDSGKFIDPLSFKDYIKSFKSGFSWFVCFMENSNEFEDKPKSIPRIELKNALIDQYIRLTGVSTTKGRQGIETQLNRLYVEYGEIEKSIGLVYSKWNTKYALHFQTFNLFCETHIQYLKTYKEIGIGHLSCGKKEGEFRPVWKKFIEYAKAEYGISLYPVAKDVIRMKRCKWLANEGGRKADDFENGYLKEDRKLLNEGRYLK